MIETLIDCAPLLVGGGGGAVLVSWYAQRLSLWSAGPRYGGRKKRADQERAEAEKRLEAERADLITLREAWSPVPGSPLDWSLSTRQDEIQDELDRLRGTQTPASGRTGRPAGGASWTEAANAMIDEAEQEPAISTSPRATVVRTVGGGYAVRVKTGTGAQFHKVSSGGEAYRLCQQIAADNPPTVGRWVPPEQEDRDARIQTLSESLGAARSSVLGSLSRRDRDPVERAGDLARECRRHRNAVERAAALDKVAQEVTELQDQIAESRDLLDKLKRRRQLHDSAYRHALADESSHLVASSLKNVRNETDSRIEVVTHRLFTLANRLSDLRITEKKLRLTEKGYLS